METVKACPCPHACNILDMLRDISVAFDQHQGLEPVLQPVLKRMAEHLSLERGTLTLFRQDQGQVLVELAYGLAANVVPRGRFMPGEGITGRVAATGKPIIVPRLCDEPEFLNRTHARESLEGLAYLCVPIIRQERVVGTLAADRRLSLGTDLNEDVRLLEVIAHMISERVAVHLLELEKGGEEAQRLREENALLREALASVKAPTGMVGNSRPMRQVYALIERVAKSTATVLVLGESGAGKELVARAIHDRSPRSKNSFIAFNCAALPEGVIESELFGHEKGAFTGAIAERLGRFELAQGGTLFLDEVGELPLTVQVKLLRVLQERELERVGGSKVIKVDARLIAATNRDLQAEVKAGRFREDLFYRLNVFPMRVPPLRERRTDIPLLIDHFIHHFSKEHQHKAIRVSSPAIDMLVSYSWPGNVRELANTIERAVLLCDEGVLRSHHLPPTLQTGEGSGTELKGMMQAALDQLEKEFLVEALKAERGNMAGAARRLGLTERILGLRMGKHDLEPRDYRLPKH
jgi:Nif-specific regulatory protein